MTKRAISISIILIFTASFSMQGFTALSSFSKKETQLANDLKKVWPFSQTVKVEYELVLAQLEIMENDSMEKAFLADYEEHVKDTYFDLSLIHI